MKGASWGHLMAVLFLYIHSLRMDRLAGYCMPALAWAMISFSTCAILTPSAL